VQQSFLIHYHEINLKRSNRGWFEGRLHQHVEALLTGLPHAGVRRFGGRMIVSLSPESPMAEIERRLKWASGIANFAPCWETPADLEQVRAALACLTASLVFRTFKIDARRSTKAFPLTSQQLNEDLGRFVQLRTGAAVRLENPELTCFVEIVGPRAYLYFRKIPGLGGLPPRTGGKVVCLISGGIDSPVAAFRLMRRGCRAHFVHFHSYPQTTMESMEKVRMILRILSRYQLESELHLVPFAELQREIVAYTPPALRVLLYRRFMMRVAEALGRKLGAAALATGDCLGQVASQTLENLRAVSAAVQLPILRPLIGDDKEDIIRIGREIGTYELSILPDQDCCTMFVPRHPETMASIPQVEKAEAGLDVPRLVNAALAAATRENVPADFLRETPAVPQKQPRQTELEPTKGSMGYVREN
jgi:thiamine biosynthesis protein ThiI